MIKNKRMKLNLKLNFLHTNRFTNDGIMWQDLSRIHREDNKALARHQLEYGGNTNHSLEPFKFGSSFSL